MSDASTPASLSAPGAATAAAATAGDAAAWEARLDQLLAGLQILADEADGQPDVLLQLLRRLENLHRTIQDGPFRSSLPADRGELFNLLQSMEKSGGWPYIPRLQLRTFMDLLQSGEAGTALAA